jgi:pentapeptide repeat protein
MEYFTMDYRRGLATLKARLQASQPERIGDFTVLEARLLENLENEQLFGTNETIRAERARALFELNRLAPETIGFSFNDLCLSLSSTGQSSSPINFSSKMDEEVLQIVNFKDRVANIFRALNYRVITHQTLAGREVDIICKKTDLPIPVTYILECYDRDITIDDIDRLNAKLAAIRRQYPLHASSIPVIVHQGQMAGNVYEYAISTGIECYEYVNLIREVWVFDRYLNIIDQLYSESDIHQYYVPLNGRIEEGDHIMLDGYLNSWLADGQRRYLALLGDYGTGKSWTCLRLAKQLADTFRVNPNNNPLPILISFRRYRANYDLESLVKAELAEQYGVDIPKVGSITKLLSGGNIILILDGMDEMAKTLGERSALLSFSKLGLPLRGPKVLITCRTHYFYSGNEQREILNSKSNSAILMQAPKFEIIHVDPLDDRKKRKYIKQRFDRRKSIEIESIINNYYNLRELSSRPVLLQMICDSYSIISEIKTPINSALLYEAYTQNWLQREMLRGRLCLEPGEFLAIIEDISALMIQNDILLFDLQIIQAIVSDFLNRNRVSSIDIKDVERQLITSTFIRRTSSDKWEFAHRSFQEFFYARKFFRWEEETNGKGTFLMTHVPVWQFAAQISVSRWNHTKSLKWIPKRIDRSNDPSLTLTTLRAAAAYCIIKNKIDSLTNYSLDGIMLDWVDLREIDFSLCDLKKADFSFSDLSSSILREACLKEALLFHTNLTNADFSSADLGGADCRNAIFVNTRFNSTNIANADFRRAYFGPVNSSEWRQVIESLLNCPGSKNAHFDESIYGYSFLLSRE